MSWGIADTAPDIEKIKAESADYLNGLNSCGVIDYSTYSNAFDFYADLLDKAYEQGQKDTERKTGHWIETEGLDEEIRCLMCTNHMRSDRGCDGACQYNEHMYKEIMSALEKRKMEVENESD